MIYENNRLISQGRAQKIGTMEKDVLIARGLDNFINELFTCRSDSISHRKKIISGGFNELSEFGDN